MTTTTPITQDEINAVFPTVAATMADALGCDVEDIKPNVSLIEGLDAESIDFLDMVFRLERSFKIKIPRGKIVENARGALTEAEFEQKGLVTDVGMAQLKSYLSEVPAERFRSPMKVADIPRLFTPETFCKLVVQAQRDAASAA
ncbi:MAG: acyl carrier protein [Burkholderiales bacterium]|nr:acyl carrier protein [Burkholderiales bacterium]